MRNKKLLFLVLFLAVALAVSGCGKKETPKQLVVDNVGNVQQVDENVDENQAGEQEEKTSIIYAYNNFNDGATKVFKSDINGNNKVELDINYGDGVRFTQNKDDKYIIGWDKDKMEIALTKDLLFKNIFNVSIADEILSSVLISNDSKKILFLTQKFLKPDEQFSPTEKYIYIMNIDGSEKKLVKKFTEPNIGDLLGVNLEKEEFYWFEGGGGGGEFYNFTTLNLQNGSVKDIKKDINLFGNSFIFSSDFSKGYFIEGNKIFEYNFIDDNKKMLYEFSNEHGNEIKQLMISPNDDMLIFAKVMVLDNREVIFFIDLKGGQVNTLLDDSRYPNIVPSHWSLDGNYLWFETYYHRCGHTSEYYIMNMSTKELNLFFKGIKDECEKTSSGILMDEHLNFIGWIIE